MPPPPFSAVIAALLCRNCSGSGHRTSAFRCAAPGAILRDRNGGSGRECANITRWNRQMMKLAF